MILPVTAAWHHDWPRYARRMASRTRSRSTTASAALAASTRLGSCRRANASPRQRMPGRLSQAAKCIAWLGWPSSSRLSTDSVKRLYPSGEVLADELTHAVTYTVQQREAPSAPLAMEVATSVLYLEASLEDGDFDHPQMGYRVQCLASRIAAVRAGVTAEPLEGWMEELYRRVSDRQTMGSVVQELRISLVGIRKAHRSVFPRSAGSKCAGPSAESVVCDAWSVVGPRHGPGLGRRACACATTSAR